MSNPLLGFLTKGALQALPSIQALVTAGGLTPGQILSTVRAAGFSIRTQVGLDLIGVLQNNINAARAIRVTPSNIALNPASHGVAPGIQRRNYNYKVLVRSVSPEGEFRNDYTTIASDVPLSVDQITTDAEANFKPGGMSETRNTIEELTVVDALRSQDVEV